MASSTNDRNPPYLWVQFGQTQAVEVSTDGCRNINDFKKAVKNELPLELDKFSVNKISLHVNGNEEPLRSGLLLSKIPSLDEISDENPLVVRTDYVFIPKKKLKTSFALSRKLRWDILNPILRRIEKESKKKKLVGYAAYSDVEFKDIEKAYEGILVPYTQDTQKQLPDGIIDKIQELLDITKNKLGKLSTGKEAKRILFIYPILLYVAEACPGVRIGIEEDLNGQYVRVKGHFEFILSRVVNGIRKSVCIVEAKKEKMEQGLVQDLLGMEAASDIYELDIVYGIVSSFKEWYFLRSMNDKVEMDEDMMKFGDKEHLKRIATKIYNILAD
jgi:hypothetical protein